MKGINCLYKDCDRATKSTRKRLDSHRGTPDTHRRLCFEKAQEMSGRPWVLLVAGSKGWKNYRHQANVCGLYQIIKRHGIPDQQIVTMMYDDIADNGSNPLRGNIACAVTSLSNVYSGVLKDYTGEDVNPANFLKVLQGDKLRKVIESGRNDKIFVYMSGLGDKGTFGFPEQSLSATDLIMAVNSMSDNEQFSKMVFYIDSDYSATMFKGLSKLKNVYAVTSCDESQKNKLIDYNKKSKVFISDEFSSALLNFLNTDFKAGTLKDLFASITTSVTTGPEEFGDLTISDLNLSDFLQK